MTFFVVTVIQVTPAVELYQVLSNSDFFKTLMSYAARNLSAFITLYGTYARLI